MPFSTFSEQFSKLQIYNDLDFNGPFYSNDPTDFYNLYKMNFRKHSMLKQEKGVWKIPFDFSC